ncbi:MAG: FAD-dependent oxidoreductase [Candidatus Nanoarchaeia archaeon]
MKIGIIGGGIAGLSSAYELSKKGHEVTVFSEDIGGLAKGEGNIALEPFYHHFFLSDKELINLIKEIELSEKIHKKATPMGFYVNGKLYPFTGAIDLLKFKPLSFFDRIKAGLLVLYFQHKKKSDHFDTITIKDYMKKKKLLGVYNTVWSPLLKSKFTINADRIPILWLWGRIHPRSKSREKGKEHLYYPIGSFKIIFERLKKLIQKNKGKFVNENIEKIEIKNKKVVQITTKNKSYEFDLYIAAIPNPALNRIAELPAPYKKELDKIKYQAAICVTFFLKKEISKYYWVNINDKNLPFAGFIEHTNFVDKKNYKNQTVVYLFNYLHETHPLLKKTDEEVYKLYVSGLKKMFKNFEEKNIVSYKVSRAKHASPIYDLNYLKKRPEFKTPVSNLYLLNTSQIYPEDRNVNNGIKYAKTLIKELEEKGVIK